MCNDLLNEHKAMWKHKRKRLTLPQSGQKLRKLSPEGRVAVCPHMYKIVEHKALSWNWGTAPRTSRGYM